MTVLMYDGTALVCRFGVVQSLPTVIHEPDNGRPCVHLIGQMPQVFAVCRASVQRLNFQPRFAADPPRRRIDHGPVTTVRHGVIAARREDLLILSAELIGPPTMRHPGCGARERDQRVHHHWRYTLHDVDDDPDVLLAVLQ